MEKEKLIEILNADLQDEHGAIIQYLTQAFSIGEGEMSCELEGIAREEMRHLDWLAEAIVELGGTPSIKRGTMRMSGTQVSEWMQNSALLEEDAIRNYKEHIRMIDDPKIKRLLERILSDEESHHGDFVHFIDKSKREGMTDQRGTRQDDTTKMINWGIEHEYTVILQYMLHSYMATNAHMKKEMEDQAINEMQHLGWLAEEMIDAGASPVIEHTEINQSTKMSDMLKADISIEKKVAAEYDRAAGETDDPSLKKLLTRIRDHEIYHTKVFEDLLKEADK